jgi:hypothetical protein
VGSNRLSTWLVGLLVVAAALFAIDFKYDFAARTVDLIHGGSDAWVYDAQAFEKSVAAEDNWLSHPQTPCDSFGKGKSPQICVDLVGPDAMPFGTPVQYRLRWRNAPQGAYIGVWSINAARAERRWRYRGAQGSIESGPFNLPNSGQMLAEWDGKSIRCAPSDFPTKCDVGEVGTFKIRVALLSGVDPAPVGWPADNPTPTKWLAASESAPFTLQGEPRGLKGFMNDGFARLIPHELVGNDRYHQRESESLGPWQPKDGNYCALLNLALPMEGNVSLCFPESRRDQYGLAAMQWDYRYVGTAKLAKGLLSAEQAIDYAKRYGRNLAKGTYRFDHYPNDQDEAMFEARPRVLLSCMRPENMPNFDWSRFSPTERMERNKCHVVDGVEIIRHPREDIMDYRQRAEDLWRKRVGSRITYLDFDQPGASFRNDGNGSTWWLVDYGLAVRTTSNGDSKSWGRLLLRVKQDGTVCPVLGLPRRSNANPNELPEYSPCLVEKPKPVDSPQR